MSPTVPLALFGFFPLSLAAMAWRPGARTVLALYIAGFLLLPVATYALPGFVNFSKISAIALSVAAAIAIFDSRQLARFTPRWIDLPVIVFCTCPIATSLSNDLGLYNGVSSAIEASVNFGLPYLTGRLYFADLAGQRQLAIGIFVGALAYVPLCLIELRFSPQLHRLVYGFHQHLFNQTVRYGGFRPMVFLNHGLMLGLWMAMGSLIGIALWSSGALRRLFGVPLTIWVPVLVVTTVLCRSTGALILLAVGLALLGVLRWTRSAVPMAILVVVPVLYVGVRASGLWSGQQAVEWAQTFGDDRAQSIQFRFDAEDMLVKRALEQPLFGWGGYGRSMLREDAPDPDSTMIVVDGLWILVFGMYGAVGLTALVAIFLTPIAALWRRLPPRHWTHPAVLPTGLTCVIAGLFLVDCLMNALVNPIFFVALGGLSGLALTSRRALALQVARSGSKAPRALRASRASAPPTRRQRRFTAPTLRPHRVVVDAADFLAPSTFTSADKRR